MKNNLRYFVFKKSRLAALCCLTPAMFLILPPTYAAMRTPEGVTPAENSTTTTPDQRRWTINQQNSDLREFINQVAAITGETFILDPRIKGGNTVTVISSRPMTRDQVYDVFLEVLNANGYTVAPKGKVMNIIPNTIAKTSSVDTKEPPRNATMLTRVIELHSVSAVEVIPIIRPLIAQYGHAAASASSNSIIVSDVSDNVDRIQRLVQELDNASNNDYEVIQLKHAWVGDVAKILQEILNTGKGQLPSGLQVIADERSNRLVVKGNASKRARVRKLAETLDQEGIRKSSTRVMFLRYAEAKNLAEILTEASQNIKDSAESKSPASKSSSKKSRAPATPTKSPGTTQGKGLGDVFIKADESQNALIMIADPETLQELEGLVRQLDIRRAQVLIEAAIVEVSGTVDDALGIQWGIDGRKTGISGGENATGVKPSIMGFAQNPSGIGTVALRNSNFGVLVTALSEKSNANLLSTPSLMTLDNQEAELLVGQEVPFKTGSYTTSSSGSSDNPFTTVDRKDVGIKLKVTPHINDGNIMRLEIEQEISKVLSSSSQSSDLTTTKRQLKTTVLIDDGETIVLGGLLQDDMDKTQSKVPLLGDIPFFGELFTYNKDRREKRNLMLFIRPTIVRDSDKMAELTQGKYSSIKVIGSSDAAKSIDARSLLPPHAEQLFLPPAIDLRKDEPHMEQKDESATKIPESSPTAAPAG